MRKSKRILSLMLAMLMLFFSLPIGVLAEGETGTFTVEANKVSGKPGEEVEVVVSLTENPGIIGFGIEVTYDSDVVEVIEDYEIDQSGKRVDKNPVVKSPIGEWIVKSEHYNDNPYKILINEMFATSNLTQTGEIMRVRFKIKETAAFGESEIKVSFVEGGIPYGSDLKDLEKYATVNGSVTVEEEAHEWTGEGTQANPYLLINSKDLELLQTRVNIDGETFKDKYFKFENDLELPLDWEPLGKNSKTAYFGGNIDGNNKTLTPEFITFKRKKRLKDLYFKS